MAKVDLTTMVMIEDKSTGKVLVQDRIKSWVGLSFPGGHVENGESFVDCAIREMKEETGLKVSDLKACGVMNWYNNETQDRYIVHLYKTTSFSGELIKECNEGNHSWKNVNELRTLKQENGFHQYIEIFMNEDINEGYCSWNEKEPWIINYK